MAKAGIIKSGKPVVIGPMDAEAEAVIRSVAHEQNSRVFSVEEAYGSNLEDYLLTSLHGAYQRTNAATAILVSQVIKSRFPVDDETALQSLQSVDWPGRWQVVNIGGSKLILDCAHNEAGAKGLAENLELLIKEEGTKPIVIVGVLGEYRAKAMMPIVAQYADTIILAQPNTPRAIEIQSLKKLIPSTFTGQILERDIKDLFPSHSICNIHTEGRAIVATGSIYLIGEIMEQIGMDVK